VKIHPDEFRVPEAKLRFTKWPTKIKRVYKSRLITVGCFAGPCRGGWMSCSSCSMLPPIFRIADFPAMDAPPATGLSVT